MDPLGAVCSMTNPSQSNQISMTNFARSQQKKLRKICGKFNFFCGILNPTILAFRMYGLTLPTTLALPGTLLKNKRPDPEVIASAVRECVGDEISVKDLEKRQHSNTNVFMEQCLVNSLYYIFIQI